MEIPTKRKVDLNFRMKNSSLTLQNRIRSVQMLLTLMKKKHLDAWFWLWRDCGQVKTMRTIGTRRTWTWCSEKVLW